MGKAKRCKVTDCPREVAVILRYVSKETGEENGGAYCLSDAETKLTLFRRIAGERSV